MSWPEVVVIIVTAIWSLVWRGISASERKATEQARTPLLLHRQMASFYLCSCGEVFPGESQEIRAIEYRNHLFDMAVKERTAIDNQTKGRP